MKVITKSIPLYKTIEIADGIKTENIYVSFDGKEFTSKTACENYENTKIHYQKLNEIKSKKFNFQTIDELEFPSRWYFVSNDDELKTVLKELMFYDKYQKISLNNYRINESTDFPLNQWYSAIYHDGGDYESDNRFYTLEFFRKELDEFLNAFNV